MLTTNNFGDYLKQMGFGFCSGVPCSFLKNLINYAANHLDYVAAVNEGDAVAIASGAVLGGKKAMVLMQNSGLANALSPLTSLNYIFKIPVLGFVSLRGETGLEDEPQHELTGVTTEEMLTTARVETDYLSTNLKKARRQLEQANDHIEKGRSFFFIVRKNTFSTEKLAVQPFCERPVQQMIRSKPAPAPMTRLAALEVISKSKDDDTCLLACTGKCGRELFEIGDSPHNFYMVGSMGCVGPLGLGLSMARPDKKVVAVDGDGALLMRMGSLAANARYASGNLLHILLDNQTYDSTGGQATCADFTDFMAVAHSLRLSKRHRSPYARRARNPYG